jgi:hypothetical protein
MFIILILFLNVMENFYLLSSLKSLNATESFLKKKEIHSVHQMCLQYFQSTQWNPKRSPKRKAEKERGSKMKENKKGYDQLNSPPPFSK